MHLELRFKLSKKYKDQVLHNLRIQDEDLKEEKQPKCITIATFRISNRSTIENRKSCRRSKHVSTLSTIRKRRSTADERESHGVSVTEVARYS